MNIYKGYTFINTNYGDTGMKSVEFEAKDRETFLKEMEKEEHYVRNYHFTPSDFELDSNTSFVFDKILPGIGYEVVVITKIIEDDSEEEGVLLLSPELIKMAEILQREHIMTTEELKNRLGISE